MANRVATLSETPRMLVVQEAQMLRTTVSLANHADGPSSSSCMLIWMGSMLPWARHHKAGAPLLAAIRLSSCRTLPWSPFVPVLVPCR